MKSLKVFAVVAAVMSLVACGQSDHMSGIPVAGADPQNQAQTPVHSASQPQVQTPQQAPVVVNNESSSVMPALLGAAAGYMLGSSMNNQPRVVEREVIREVPSSRIIQRPAPVVVPKPAPVTPPKFAAPVVPKPQAVPQPAPKPSFSQGGYSSVRQSAPSYRSSPRVSFGGRR